MGCHNIGESISEWGRAIPHMRYDLQNDVRVPKAVTLRTFADTDAGENLVPCENAHDMFARLG